MSNSKTSLQNYIDALHKSKSISRLYDISCYCYREKNPGKVRNSTELSHPDSGHAQDDREEIQLVIDRIRKEIPEPNSTKNPDEVHDSLNRLEKLEQNMNSVVLIVRKEDLQPGKDNNHYRLRSQKLKDRKIFYENRTYTICPDSRYAEQQSADSLGTGFFISPNVILTAAHVIYPPFYDLKVDENLDETDPSAQNREVRFITNFRVTEKAPREDSIHIPKADVYKPAGNDALRASRWASLGADWAMIRVAKENGEPIGAEAINRTVVDYHAEIDEKTYVHEQRMVYCLGHGFGLPMKVALQGKVIELHNEYFECDLDVFSGNSGSPVIDGDTHEVIGILVRGERNFVRSNHDHGGIECLLPSTSSGKGDLEECQMMAPISQTLEEERAVNV